MPRELELSWVATLKQWRKRRKVNGKTKTFYLGTGTSKADRLSYVRALAKWHEIEETLNLAERGDKLRQQLDAWRDELASRPGVDASVYLIATKSKIDETKPLSASMQRWLDGTARLGEDRFAPLGAAASNQKTMGQAVADYIEAQRQRYEHGLRFPNAPQRERISGIRFISYRYNAQLIKADWENEPLPKDEAGVAALMEQFKERQKSLMTAGQIEPGTLNERLKTLRHVVRWLHRKYIIQSLPREIVDICAMYRVKTTAKALDIDTIHRLWDSSSPRLKTYIALALNCGFYVTDIASLEYSHIMGDFILKDRHKTEVPTRFKLWAVTKTLLAQNRHAQISCRIGLVGFARHYAEPAANTMGWSASSGVFPWDASIPSTEQFSQTGSTAAFSMVGTSYMHVDTNVKAKVQKLDAPTVGSQFAFEIEMRSITDNRSPSLSWSDKTAIIGGLIIGLILAAFSRRQP